MLLNKNYSDGHIITRDEIIETLCLGDLEDRSLLLANMKDATFTLTECVPKTHKPITTPSA